MRASRVAMFAVLAVALTACGSPTTGAVSRGTSSAAAPQASLPSAASPVSTTAILTGRCAMGWEWVPNTTDAATGDFVPGLPPGSAGEPYPSGTSPSTGDATLAYQVTLANNSTSAADVAGFAVDFFLSNGSKSGSANEQFGDQVITPGQTRDFTVIEDHTILGHGVDPGRQLTQTSAIPGGSAACNFVEWSGGGG